MYVERAYEIREIPIRKWIN